VKDRYVPRVHPPEQVVCPQCGQEFTRIRTVGALRIYCSRMCTAAAGEERKLQRNAGLGPRRCACGAEVTTRVGKPVCPDCRKDPRGTEQLQGRERRRTLARYGLSQEQWDHLVAMQGNRCAICETATPGGRGESWHIDHDQVTGQVRGLLCHQCNVRARRAVHAALFAACVSEPELGPACGKNAVSKSSRHGAVDSG
jgi:hypothetical protein